MARLLQHVRSLHTRGIGIISDRGTSFTGAFFKTLMKLLNVHHRLSAARVSRTDGLTENLIQRVNQLIRRYCDDDTEIEHALPLIEINVKNLFDLLLSVRVMTDDLH